MKQKASICPPPGEPDDGLKAERIQDQSATVTPEHLREENPRIGDWTVQYCVSSGTPNAIHRHFPQPSFSASAAFVAQVAAEVERYGRVPFVAIDATGVTVRLGNPAQTGVTATDFEMASALIAIS